MATYSTRLLELSLIHFLSGSFFGGEKGPAEVVTAPQPGPTTDTKNPPTPSTKETEKARETHDLTVERQELYDDILSRLNSMERDYQFLKDKVSMLEFLVGDATKDSKKTKEEMRVELEKLRAQLAEYNTLILRILSRMSKEQEKQEPSPSPR
ncbi:MAG: hypothetical protein AAB048_03030 [Planctomycetota bacterium]